MHQCLRTKLIGTHKDRKYSDIASSIISMYNLNSYKSCDKVRHYTITRFFFNKDINIAITHTATNVFELRSFES